MRSSSVSRAQGTSWEARGCVHGRETDRLEERPVVFSRVGEAVRPDDLGMSLEPQARCHGGT